jgi:small subunit ribosomal protein S16
MAVKIRLARFGTRNKPFYRIVVSDTRTPRDGRFIEQIGTYDPRANPAKVKVNQDRVQHWISHGAKPTRTVSELIQKLEKQPVELEGVS